MGNDLVDSLCNEEIFIDTSAWFALMKKTDYHEEIKQKYIRILENNNQLITTNLVIGETFTLMRYRLKLQSNLPFKYLDFINNSQRIKTFWISEVLNEEIISLVKQFKDHKLSYTDAASFSIMKKEGVEYALTLDEYFSVAGFKII